MWSMARRLGSCGRVVPALDAMSLCVEFGTLFWCCKIDFGSDGDRLDGGLCWILCMQDAWYVYHRLLDSRILCEIGVLCVD